ncbi:trans-2-enoyl-CoA reductase family protein [Vibrio fluvialis]|jgi:enoyl-[acyl-carrier protein] reductase/trans-2-enoyl-CoA reductase (NAD+)|uniref:enoyl-ACP reductase FabV n=1 Tax=Vibrio fluvialis TaxID=676 RepID=UPI0006E281DD|nr:enoyl-ACP reductase FabV [Vibrio fluvialis]TNF17322.1 MAG: trans-2-enoyl-CoA reductase family protein [Vibrionaceae bacterium]EKO3367303.1 trans-2-enoyl-CoA reductase family protein [Vibrio fluvialis]EKO3370472.1 trans-2-enoyl-CoA reductase family protein [Vibrio fluvialis]EKO3437732.1 trans-2-enoyl-CoA reductase family protein [Vibrio fluvialis]EKO3442344.1 trans-2-enoyl-CoA reductase family protein [Vibrio fluvialis]
MRIEPVIQGVVARTAHPLGCEQAVLQQIEYVKSAKPITQGPKRVLILGASSGFGLAARIALTFGGAKADTIGVSFERGPSDKGVGSAGYFNNLAFKKQADREGRIAININGDVFSKQVREQVIEAIETYFEGEVDLVIYSIASGMRRKPGSEDFWRSAIKPIGEPVSGAAILLENDKWVDATLEPANEEEIDSTLRVMGGEDWEDWIDTLINTESVAQGCKTIAFSYVGPEITHPIYLDGTLGRAKIDLHQTSHSLNLKLANFDGGAYATVCKALVTKASVFIPGLSPYLLALYRVMKEKGTHEGCIEQMHRLFSDKLYGKTPVPVDGERLVRMDDWELNPDTQERVRQLLSDMNGDNFKQVGDYAGFKAEFLRLNGFGFDNVDYDADIDLERYK